MLTYLYLLSQDLQGYNNHEAKSFSNPTQENITIGGHNMGEKIVQTAGREQLGGFDPCLRI